MDKEITVGFRIAVLVVAVVVVARFASGIAAHYAHRLLPSSVSLAKVVVNVIVMIIGLLVIFQTMGIEIGPMIAALGVGGLAVALALQDTLSNFLRGHQHSGDATNPARRLHPSRRGPGRRSCTT
jgi:small-conductance mechanosensitive channel